MTEEIETTDVFERMQPRAAALVKEDQLRELRSNLEILFQDIAVCDLYLLNDILTDWVSLTTHEAGTLAACFAVRFARLAAEGQ